MPTTEPFFFEAIPPPRYDATDGQSGGGEDGEGREGRREREGAERDGREGGGREGGGRGLGLGMAGPPSLNRRRLHNQDREQDDEQQENLDISNNDTRPGPHRFWWWKLAGLLLLMMASILVIVSLIEAIYDGVPLLVIIQNHRRYYSLPSPSYNNTSDDYDERGEDHRPPPPPPLSVYLPPFPQINLTAIQSLNNNTTTTLTLLSPQHYNTTNASLTHLHHLLTHPLPCALRALSPHHYHHRPPPPKTPPPSPSTTTTKTIQQTHSLALTLSNTHLPTLLTHFTDLSPILTHALERAKTDVENARLPWWYVWRIWYFTTSPPFSEPPRLSAKEEAYLAAGRRYNDTLRALEEHARDKETVEVGREVLAGLAWDLEGLWRWGEEGGNRRQEVGVVDEGQNYGRVEVGDVVDEGQGQEEQEKGEEMQDSARPGSGDKETGRRRKRLGNGLGGRRSGGEIHDDIPSVVKTWYFGKLAAKAGMQWDEFERSWEGMVC